MSTKQKDPFTRTWIIDKALSILPRYDKGVLTIRSLYYQLVAVGMTNSQQHYKRVVAAMVIARRDNRVDYDQFVDHDREMSSTTEADDTNLEDKVDLGKRQVRAWMLNYNKSKWENQEYYPEVLIEKNALIGVFEKPCKRLGVGFGACKGYPSITFLHDLSLRMEEAIEKGKSPIIFYFGDYDPSGEDIPRSIQENLENDFGVYVDLVRCSLNLEQVRQYKLPPAPAKKSDSRTANWDGVGQVELDAMAPENLERILEYNVDLYFDEEKYEELQQQEAEERQEYVVQLKDYVKNLKLD